MRGRGEHEGEECWLDAELGVVVGRSGRAGTCLQRGAESVRRGLHTAASHLHPAAHPPLQAVRQNRLALLRDLAALPSGILDLAELPGF